jgi:hypothetical protein
MFKFFQNPITDDAIDSIAYLINHDPIFAHFREIFIQSPALLKFVYAEKIRYPLMPSEGKTMKPSNQVSPFNEPPETKALDETLVVDDYHPKQFKPFPLKGIWLPIEEASIYNVLDKKHVCPLFKMKEGKQFVLFLIHPRSEHEYEKLLDKYQDKLQTFDALSLSSFRTVLVALPNDKEGYEPIIVKLSLAKNLRGVFRLLSEKKCKIAVGNSAMLNVSLSTEEENNLGLTILKDPLAILPKGFEQAGMIYRVLPDLLNPQKPNANGIYFVPLLSLLGVKNLPFFQHLVTVSRLPVSSFLKTHLLSPIATLIIKLFYYKGISLEIHAQNLGLMINQWDRVCGLMYRDIEGVNLLMEDKDRQACLPESLQDKDIYYFDTHIKDAASAVENHFVYAVLGPLTRQLAKFPAFWDTDAELKEWIETVSQYKFIQNWTLPDLTNDDYDNNPEYQKFFRYGYVEKLFFDCLMEKLEEYDCFDPKTFKDLEEHFTQWEKNDRGELFPPCTYNAFFSRLVTLLLSQPKPVLTPPLSLTVTF